MSRMNVHTFGADGSPSPTMDDDGAPPADPRLRVTTVNAEGDIISSSAPEPAQLAADAARLAATAKTVIVFDDDTPELRKFCLELAARGGATEPSSIIRAAKEFRDFVLKGG